jgi:hypothetical protein
VLEQAEKVSMFMRDQGLIDTRKGGGRRELL